MTMTPETAAALEASIKHWEKNVAAEEPIDASTDGNDCALCEMFVVGDDVDKYCIGCPVYELTGEKQCHGSPWRDAHLKLGHWGEGDCSRDEWRVAAQAELDFLKSLRETP